MIKGHILNTINISCSFPALFAHCEKSTIIFALCYFEGTAIWAEHKMFV